MACEECRRRRISCDNAEPKCYHCSRLSKSCVYTPSNGRKTAQRRSIKELETRLAKLEAQLKASPAPSVSLGPGLSTGTDSRKSSDASGSHSVPSLDDSELEHLPDRDFLDAPEGSYESIKPHPNACTDARMSDVAEALPDLATINELNRIYFEMVHPNVPILSPTRISDNCVLSNRASPLCLQYAMWAHAAALTPRYATQAPEFYSSSRMHLDFDEIEGPGSEPVSVAHAQAWALVAGYECEHLSPKQAFMSNNRSVTLCQMFELSNLDASGRTRRLQLLPENHIEAEEWRRTFWYVVYSNQWATSGRVGRAGGMLRDEISTLLPCSEEAFNSGAFELGPSLDTAASLENLINMSPMVLAVLSGQLLENICKYIQIVTDSYSRPLDDLLRQQQEVRQELESMIKEVPYHLQPSITTDTLALHVNMCLYSFSISLDQVALDVAESRVAYQRISDHVRKRRRQAANAIVKILDITLQKGIGIDRMYPFATSMFYIASTVFVDDLKNNFKDIQAYAAIKFIIQVFRFFVKRTQSAQKFLSQLSGKLLDNSINFEIDATDVLTKMEWNGLEDDFKFLGPLFDGGLILKEVDYTQQIYGESVSP